MLELPPKLDPLPLPESGAALRLWLVLEFPLNPADGVEPGSLAPRSESLVPPLSSSLGGPLSRLGLVKGASPGFVGAKVSDVLSCVITNGEPESVTAGIGGVNAASIMGSTAAVNIDFM